MLVRIVKMEFQPQKVADFLYFFDRVKNEIATFDGCLGMKLMQDQSNPSIIFTYSHWEEQEALNKYRESELFGKVWPNVKPWFAKKPEAWSLDTYYDRMK
ncbi:MAG: antibiotic biosynthesis monooxygenase [Bacteroidetes bacterium]|nr:antibiotic biosynthesis monooxygenase [Bacteroidota bacterium]